MPSPLSVWVVEDDPILGETLSELLTDAGYHCRWINDGAEAMNELSQPSLPDLVLLDLGLPGLDGEIVLERLREQGKDVPVLVLTARDALEQRIRGLNLGADDYVVKPFDVDELLARVRALLRRAQPAGERRLRWRDVELAVDITQAWRQGEPLDLTAVELRLLHALMTHPQIPLSKSRLLQLVYDDVPEHSSNPLAVHLSKLRHKLGKDSILNERGLGWRLAA